MRGSHQQLGSGACFFKALRATPSRPAASLSRRMHFTIAFALLGLKIDVYLVLPLIFLKNVVLIKIRSSNSKEKSFPKRSL